jgi:murein DD-endopeptidase MepM/ murein hydrolase activator NlpD
MADLKGNTQYGNDYGSAMKGIIKASKGFSQTLPQETARAKPPIDLTQFQGVRQSVTAPQQTGQNQPSFDFNASDLGTITTPYQGNTRYESVHPGVDIANAIGTQVPSFSGGKVIDVATGKRQGDKGYGNYVIVEDAKGNKHRYSHLSNSYVSVGDYVPSGQYVGQMGNSGSTYSLSGGTGAHLDYRIKNAYGKYISPSQFINLE